MYKRGDIVLCKLESHSDNVQTGMRPCVIMQNDIGNKYSTTTIIVPISSKLTKKPIPTHVLLNQGRLHRESIVLCEQIATINKRQIIRKICSLSELEMNKINDAMRISIGI